MNLGFDTYSYTDHLGIMLDTLVVLLSWILAVIYHILLLVRIMYPYKSDYILLTGSTNIFLVKELSAIMTLKRLGKGHQNLINSYACLSDMSANSEIHSLVQKIYPTYITMTLKKGQVTNNKHNSNLLQSHIMQAGIKTYNFDFGIDG